MAVSWRPMREFDPTKSALMRDKRHGTTFEWHPKLWAEEFRHRSSERGPDLILWEGLLLDGWRPLLRVVK